MTKSRPVLMVFSVLVAAQVLLASASLADTIGERAYGLLALGVAAVQAAMTFYVQGQVTPNASVAAQVTSHGAVVAGEAAQQTTGQPVTVVSARK
jgi:hypothetical protein